MDICKYKSVGEWYEDAKSKGYLIPLPMCHGLDQLMKKRGLSFEDAYSLLLDSKKIILVGQSYIYDLSAQELIDNKNDP